MGQNLYESIYKPFLYDKSSIWTRRSKSQVTFLSRWQLLLEVNIEIIYLFSVK